MRKLGFLVNEPFPGVLSWNNQRTEASKHCYIDTYKDHRMALAFAPAAIKIKNLVINDALVVTKSYPHFWEDLDSVGFEINPKIS
jgi:3-phosphoshikimate 1-carboxyvinyltransferase